MITSAAFDGVNVTLSGTLDGAPDTICGLQFLASPQCGVDKEQVQKVIGTTVAAIGNDGKATFGPVSFPLPNGHMFVTADAIDSINKVQRFSNCVRVDGESPPCVPPPAHMVGWWPGEGNADDISDSGNNGTVGKGVNFATGKVAQAFDFDGVNGMIEISDSPSLNPPTITLSAWIKPNSIKSASRIVSKEMEAQGCVEPDVVYSLEAHGDLGDKPVFFFTTSDLVEHVLSAKSWIRKNVFTHVVASFDGETAKIYVNGALENNLTVKGVLASSTDAGGNRQRWLRMSGRVYRFGRIRWLDR